MTVLTILSPEEIQLFEHPLQFTAEERKHFFTVPKWAEEIIATLQTPASKVGFLLLLGYFRATKENLCVRHIQIPEVSHHTSTNPALPHCDNPCIFTGTE